MRTSRVSRETARLFDHASTSPSPRRSTRSLARFSYGAPSSPSVKNEPADIEDAVSLPRAKRIKREHTDSATSIKSETEEVKVEVKDEESPGTKAPRRQRKPVRTTTDRITGQVKVEPPSDWEAMYEAVRRMRAPGGAAYGAAVDTMGCERLADRSASPKDQRFQTLISLMLSSQTKDTTNAGAMARLRNELPPHKPGAPKGLNLDNILAVEPRLLNELIWAVGFHNNKTKYIKQAAEILRDKWNGDIPDTIEGLTSLPGVGPKMAYLCLSVAWNRTEGIGVDVHVHRITNMWGWQKTKNPEETRLSLQSWLPKDRWREINGLLVGLGQAVCLPVGSKCGDCELGLKGLCKAADRKKVAEGLKRLKLEDDEDVKLENIKTEGAGIVKHDPQQDGLDNVKPSLENIKTESIENGEQAATSSIKKEGKHETNGINGDRPVKKEESVTRDVKVKIEED